MAVVTVSYWMIEASRDGVSFDVKTFLQGVNRKTADDLAAQQQAAHPEGWKPEVVFTAQRLMRPLMQADLAETYLS